MDRYGRFVYEDEIEDIILEELIVGQLIVDPRYGICMFDGYEIEKRDGKKTEYMRLIFDNGKAIVPVSKKSNFYLYTGESKGLGDMRTGEKRFFQILTKEGTISKKGDIENKNFVHPKHGTVEFVSYNKTTHTITALTWEDEKVELSLESFAQKKSPSRIASGTTRRSNERDVLQDEVKKLIESQAEPAKTIIKLRLIEDKPFTLIAKTTKMSCYCVGEIFAAFVAKVFAHAELKNPFYIYLKSLDLRKYKAKIEALYETAELISDLCSKLEGLLLQKLSDSSAQFAIMKLGLRDWPIKSNQEIKIALQLEEHQYWQTHEKVMSEVAGSSEIGELVCKYADISKRTSMFIRKLIKKIETPNSILSILETRLDPENALETSEVPRGDYEVLREMVSHPAIPNLELDMPNEAAIILLLMYYWYDDSNVYDRISKLIEKNIRIIYDCVRNYAYPFTIYMLNYDKGDNSKDSQETILKLTAISRSLTSKN